MEGDEEEDDIDDLENEFNFEPTNGQDNDMHHALATRNNAMISCVSGLPNADAVVHTEPPQLPLLCNGQKVYLISFLLVNCARNSYSFFVVYVSYLQNV